MPAVMLLADTMTLPLLWEHRGHLRPDALRHAPPFAPWSIVFLLSGVAVGAVLLGRVGPAGGRLALGVVILAFVGFHLRRSHRQPGRTAGAGNPAAARGAAAAGGLLDGWLGTGGVAIAMYLTWCRFAPSAFVAALLSYFLVTDAVRAVNYALLGYWQASTLALYVRALPLALVGYVVGIALRRMFGSESGFRGAVLCLLIIYAVALVGRALLGC